MPRKLAFIVMASTILASCHQQQPEQNKQAQGLMTTVQPIASNFDIRLAMKNGSIPPRQPQVNEDKGAFRFICGAGQLNYDDPVVDPGQPGKSHLHQWYGNTAANGMSTYASLRAFGGSTCNIVNGALPNGVAVNRSAYWMPGMLDPVKLLVAKPDYVQVYYKREPNNSLYDDQLSRCDPKNPNGVSSWKGTCLGIPTALRFRTGFIMETRVNNNPGWFACRGTGAANKVWKANAEAMSLVNLTTCPVGSQLEMTMSSPVCWNGQTDSADHSSHLVGMRRDATTNWVSKCPTDHPYYLAQFTISAFFTIKPGDNPGNWVLASDMGMKRGSTLHFDYFEAWDDMVKNLWVECMLNQYRNGSMGQLGCPVPGTPYTPAAMLSGADSGSVKNWAANQPNRVPIPPKPTAPPPPTATEPAIVNTSGPVCKTVCA